MDAKAMKLILAVGETVAVEFKRGGNGVESDTYETVCSFLNCFGGDIYLGVEDNGNVIGVSEKAAPEMIIGGFAARFITQNKADGQIQRTRLLLRFLEILDCQIS